MKGLTLRPELFIEGTIANIFAPTSDASIKHFMSATKVTLDNLPEIIVEHGIIDMVLMQKEFGVDQLRKDMYVTRGPRLILQMEDGTIYDNLVTNEVSLGLAGDRKVSMQRIVLTQKD